MKFMILRIFLELENKSRVCLSVWLHGFLLNPDGHVMSLLNADIYSTATFSWLSAGCPYFAAQTMAEGAQLVFCPYNYLISPIVRRAMDIDISGSIVILDEAQ